MSSGEPPPDGPRSRGGASEDRLDALREQAARAGSVEGAGVRAAGGPLPAGVAGAGGAGEAKAGGPSEPGSTGPGYHGRPILKAPVWTWEVPLYFFVGGTAGMAALLALGAVVAEADWALVRAALWLGVAGAAFSPLLLILDLGRPRRFLAMLRVVKLRSPMSVGVWLLVKFGGTVTLAAVLAQWILEPGSLGGLWGAVFLLSLLGAAFFGSLVAVYTGVLLGATAVPAWLIHRALLPIHFGIAGLGSAAAALELLGFRVLPLHLLGLAVAAVETGVGVWVELLRAGPADRALREGPSGMALRVAGALAGPGALLLRALGWVPAAAVAFLLGALLSRYGWLWAGRASALDPEAALAVSRRRSRSGSRTPR